MTQVLRILIIDDNPGDRALVIRELRREFPQFQPQEIREASSFASALAAGEFDLVITDYQLGWSTGLEVLYTIKQQYPNCPVIMFTNTGSEEIAVEAMKSGLDDYVLKLPNRYIRIPAAVRVALERAEIKRRATLLEIRLQGLLNQLKLGIFRTYPDGNFIECNPAFLELLGLDSLSQASAMNLLNINEYYSILQKLPPPQQQEQEIQLQRADGRPIWVGLSIALNVFEGQQVIDGLIEDITSRKQAEIEIQQLNQTLEERVRERTAELEVANRNLAQKNQELAVANQDLEAFTYSISHDLREPLRAIQMFGSILLENQDRESNLENHQDYLQRIIASTQQADKLVQDLLEYSRLSRTEMPLQPINLSLLMIQILRQLELEITQRQARVQVEEPLAEVTGNPTILIQVVTNLLTNAIKFVAPEIQPQLRIWTEKRNKLVRLWVEDNGIGIEERYQKRIFNAFERLHSYEVYPGSGIGLAIVRKGVERMGGQVGVESQPGQGSRFWIDLPIVIDVNP
ncbi:MULTISPECIES: sensor histidine kinase [unclassified Nostoc]|uniref:sensor histidine kinase n=1 Tax=unclassified Nostoc TaxID=2593658 RepID=UPI002AD5AB6F|nr:ATP-binding protein [Nostoc sp. DedQUE03]MDZ7976352.1 ATP-binding protein [Nostoc sp. DedQUE03]MDZ8047966.1 ATP-binding protein [Nostoc sp. DedQUE02]